MDKILITMFKPEIATAILNSQEKLNPDKNAYIDRNELPGVLDFFGVNDVSKLLTEEAQSIFQNVKPADTDVNMDVLELSQKTVQQIKPEETELIEGNTKETANTKDVNTVLTEQGTAAFELDCIISADLTMSAIGSPYAQQMENLQNIKKECEKAGMDYSDIDDQIDALKKMVEEYMREHPDATKDRIIVKEISYGHDGKKKAQLAQSFGLTGNKEIKPNSASTETSEVPDNTLEGSTNTYDTSNNTDAEISYKIDLRTLNPENEGNWHIKGTVNAGSNNSDIHAAALYKRPFKNGGIINFSGNFRQTIENQHNITTLGASLDYNRNKFSTGLFGIHNSEEIDDTNSKMSRVELYGKYGRSIRAAVGYQDLNGASYYYTRGKLQGKREFPTTAITINGGIGFEYGLLDVGGADSKIKNIELKANGGITFKGRGFDANIGGNIARSEIKFTSENRDYSDATTTASLLGKISTENFDLSTTISSINVSYFDSNNDSGSTLQNRTNVTTSITLGIKKIFGDNVMPTFSYNTGNYDGANKNLTVGVVIIP